MKRRGGAFGLAGGIAVALSLPPGEWWFLAPFGVWLVLEGVAGRDLRVRAVGGAAFGFGWMSIGLLWVIDFHAVGYVALLLIETVIIGAGVLALQQRRIIFIAPAVFAFIELFREVFPFGGMPLSAMSIGQVSGPLLPVAGMAGAFGVTAVVGGLGATLYSLRRRQMLDAVGAIAVIAVLIYMGHTSLSVDDVGSPIEVAAVQGGGVRGLRAIEDDADAVFSRHMAAANELKANEFDLVVFPENVLSVDGSVAESLERFELARLARRLDSDVIVGVVEREDERFRNAAVDWDAFGRISGRYEKYHRVPFGEYVPLRGVLKHVVDLSVLPRDAIVGDYRNTVQLERVNVGVLISYEVFFGARGRQAALKNAEILVVPTNASSYRGDAVPAQEVAAAQLRAVETSRWVVQAAPTGYSAIVSPEGVVVEQSPLGEREVLQHEVTRRKGHTPYTLAGGSSVVIALGVTLMWATLTGRNKEDE